MLLDLINIEKVRRAIIYFGLILAVLLVQNSILDKIPVMGVRAMFLPVMAVAVGFFEGGVWGGVFGLILGLLSDMSLNQGSVLFTILFPLVGFFSGALTMFFLTRRFVAFFILSLGALFVSTFFQLFGILVFSDTQLLPVLFTGLLQILWSIPFIFAVYFPCKGVSGLDLSK